MKRVLTCLFILLTITVFIACSKKNNTKEIKDGIEFIKNKDIPSNPDFNVILSKEFEIDLAEMKFEKFINLSTDKNANLYVLTSRKRGEKNFIHKFDKNGNYLKSFGKNYFDPSAFGSTICIEDTLFLFEPTYNNRKLIMFTLDGELIGEKGFDTSKTGFPHKFKYLNKNSFVIERSLTGLDSGITQKSMHIYDSKFKYVTRFFAVRHKNRSKIKYPTYFLKDNIYMFRDKKNYLIEIFNDKGKKIKEISKEFAKVKYTEEEIHNIIENYKKRFPKYDLPDDKAREMSIGLSDYKDVIMNIFVDKNNRLWIQKFVEDYHKIYFDIFENGIFLNSIELETKIFNKLFFIGNHIYELQVNEGKIMVYSYD